MTEDEAFIRTIVDRPGDDLPRLVYADWLDERDDSRGAYLRAEVEWAKAKQKVGFIVLRLNGLAEGLDPVWVARVSRPPVGVCCEHVNFTETGPRITAADLDTFEQRVGLPLTPEYRAFLLNVNGGKPAPSVYTATDPVTRSQSRYGIAVFHSLFPEDIGTQPTYSNSLLSAYRAHESEFDCMRDHLVVGHDSSVWSLLLRVNAPHVGTMIRLDVALLGYLELVSHSLPTLLDSIR